MEPGWRPGRARGVVQSGPMVGEAGAPVSGQLGCQLRDREAARAPSTLRCVRTPGGWDGAAWTGPGLHSVYRRKLISSKHSRGHTRSVVGSGRVPCVWTHFLCLFVDRPCGCLHVLHAWMQTKPQPTLRDVWAPPPAPGQRLRVAVLERYWAVQLSR